MPVSQATGSRCLCSFHLCIGEPGCQYQAVSPATAADTRTPAREPATRNPMQHTVPVTFRFALPHDADAIRAIEFEAGQRFISVGMAGIADAPPMARDLVERKIAAGEIIVAVDAEATC